MGNTLIYTGKVIQLLHKDVKLPNGFIAGLDIIKHPGAVLIVPFESRNKIIMLKQFRPVLNQYIHELPAGTLKSREAPFSCAQRELIEETGYGARKMQRIGEIVPVPGYSTEKIIIYKAEQLIQKTRRVEEDEVIEHSVYSKRQIQRMFRDKKIIDAKTMCALALCGWL